MASDKKIHKHGGKSSSAILNASEVLKNAGLISAEIAKKLAIEHYEKFRVIQDQNYESDFDKEIKRLKGED